MTSCDQLPVNKKMVSKEKKGFLKKFVSTVIVTGTIASAVVIGGADVLNHPENYDTTHPDFEGRATFSQVMERTPDNIKDITGRGM